MKLKKDSVLNHCEWNMWSSLVEAKQWVEGKKNEIPVNGKCRRWIVKWGNGWNGQWVGNYNDEK